jgi:hypothetical protein
MKRDLDLIRKILLKVESSDDSPLSVLNLDGYEEQTILFHVALLVEAEYMKANISQALSGIYRISTPIRLTWEGYEFLDLLRSEGTWAKAKSIIKEKSISISIAILTELLKSIAKDALGLSNETKLPLS